MTPGPRPPVEAPVEAALETAADDVTDEEEDASGQGPRATLLAWWRAHPRAVLAATVGLSCGIAWAAWTAARLGDPAVTWQVYGYRVVSDSQTRVTVLVTRDPGVEAVCRIKALDSGFAEVGSVEVTVPVAAGDSAETVRLGVDIPTTRTAVTGTVDSCAVRSR